MPSEMCPHVTEFVDWLYDEFGIDDSGVSREELLRAYTTACLIKLSRAMQTVPRYVSPDGKPLAKIIPFRRR